MRKHADPTASGLQTSRSYDGCSSPVCIAWKVSTLNNSVPTNWSTLLHQSIRRGSKAIRRTRCRRPPPPGPRSALKVSRHWSVAAAVKNIEPTNNTIPSTPDPTSSTNPRNGAIRKQLDPTAKRTPIHHDTRSGAHQTRSCPATRESRDACLRFARDDHSEVLPSGRRKVRWVVNGPTARRRPASTPRGPLGTSSCPAHDAASLLRTVVAARTGAARLGPAG